MSAKKSRKGGTLIEACFRHLTSGELIEASKYGLKGFPMRSTKKKPKSF